MFYMHNLILCFFFLGFLYFPAQVFPKKNVGVKKKLSDSPQAPKKKAEYPVIVDFRKISFSEGLENLLKNNAKIHQSNAQVLSFEALRKEADGAGYPQLTLLSFVAPVYEVRGNALKAERNYSNWGPLVHGQAQLVWPVFTFGRLANARSAADNAIDAGRHLKESQINKTMFEYKQLYLQLILLRRFHAILKEANEKMQIILEKADEAFSSGEGEVQRKDIARLKIFDLELKKLNAEWSMNHHSATLALSHYMGFEEPADAVDTDFPKVDKDAPVLARLLEEGMKQNPDFKAIQSGLRARYYQIETEKGGLLPVLFLGAQYEQNYSPMADYQNTPYAWDPYNRGWGGVAFGARWELDWGKVKAKEAKAKAEYEELKARANEARTGIPLKISAAFYDLTRQRKYLELSRSKYKEASKWSISEMSAYSSGVGDTRDLLEALGALMMAEKEMADAEYQYCLAWAKMSLEVGDGALLKDWVKSDAE